MSEEQQSDAFDAAVELVFTGDIMLSREIGRTIAERGEKLIAPALADLFQAADLTIANLESPVSADAARVRPDGFRAHPDALSQIAGIDLVSLANNHMMDCGLQGMQDTLSHLKAFKLPFTGVRLDETSGVTPYRCELKGRKLAFFACAADKYVKVEDPVFPRLVPASSEELLAAIKKENQSGGFVVVLVHGGNEMVPYPEPKFMQLCRSYVDAGASLVVTTGPHVLGGAESYKDGQIFYSLGDFVFDSDSTYRNRGGLLRVRLGQQVQWELIPTNIKSDYHVGLATELESNKILKRHSQVTETIQGKKYEKEYTRLYTFSFLTYQLERFYYKLRYRGIAHTCRFIADNALSVLIYARRVVLRRHK